MALIVKIGADLKNFDKEMKKLTKDVNRVGTKLQDAGKKMTAAFTVPAVAVGVASAKIGSDFEAAMSKVAAISGATGGELDALTEKARDMGATTKFSASEAADALGYMAMAGWKTEDMLSGIDGVMALAAASGEDLASVSDIVTDALTAFGLSAEDSGKFADILAAASSNANTNVSMLGESFKYVAPVAGALGYTAEDTSKALSLMANAGIKGTQSGTALRTMLTNLSSPTASMKTAMDELGISLTNNDGTMKTLDEIMQDLRTSFNGLDESQQAAYASTIFGKEAMSGALAIIGASEEDYNKLSVAINNSNGAAQQMADIMGNNLSGKLQEMKSAFEEVALNIFERLQPALELVVSGLQKMADWFNNLSPPMQNFILGIGLFLAAIGPLLVIVGTGIILFGQLQAALTILGVGLGGLLGPIALIVAAIVGIIAVFTLFGDEIKAFWDEYFKPVIDEIVKIVVETLQPAFDAAFTTIKTIVKDAFEIIKRLWNEILKPVLQFIISFIQEKVLPVWRVVFSVIGSVVSEAFGVIKNLWTNTLKPIFNGIIDFISGIFSGNWEKAWSGVKSIFKGVFEGLKTIAKAPINFIISALNGFIKGINKIKIPDWVPAVGGKGINIPLIPKLATGGNIFGSGTAIVGEAGPELIQKSGSSVKVTPLSSQEKANGFNGGSEKIEIPVFLDGYEIARASYDYINNLLESDASNHLFMKGVR